MKYLILKLIIFSKIKLDFTKNITYTYLFKIYTNKQTKFLPKINIVSPKKKRLNPDVNQIKPDIHKYDVDFLFDTEDREYEEQFSTRSDIPLNLKINRTDDFTFKNVNPKKIIKFNVANNQHLLTYYMNLNMLRFNHFKTLTNHRLIF